MAYLRQEIQRYAPGQTLTLYPRDPLPPHGFPDLPNLATVLERLDLKEDLAGGGIHNFDPITEFASEELAKVQVLRSIKGGIGSGAQLLLCEVLQVPTHTRPMGEPSHYKSFNAGLKVVLKVFDPIFFPDADDWDHFHRGMKSVDRAEAHISRESKALRHLYDRGLTGHPYLAPQYHGSWAMKFKLGDSSGIHWRCAGAVLMEYIEGVSMDSMYDRENVLHIDPDKTFVGFPGSQGIRGMSFSDMSTRMKLLRTLLDGCVSFLHAGINTNTFFPDDIFITLGNNGVDLQEPRVVFLDYTCCVVWSDTLTSQIGRADEYDSELPKVPSRYLLNVHPLERLPRPPHPAWKYNPSNLYYFDDWFPSKWKRCETPFYDWLVKECDTPTAGRYSTYHDLVRVMEDAISRAKTRYLIDTAKDEAALERGDPTLLRYKFMEEQRLRQAALEQQAEAHWAENHAYFMKLFEERQKAQANQQPRDGDKKPDAPTKFSHTGT
ncbi:hypothetical protein LY76DRAFT_659931 [Colletotrichum caudatum]|nr:hypothetical protein LY76DRAFT_659931 [Colletotrichum caudatum]